VANPIPVPQKTDEKIFLVIVIALAVVAGIGSWFAAAAFARHDQVHGILPDKERTLGEFSLTDENGRTVTRAELEGKILVVSFLFTGCALTCPEVTKRMAEIQQLTATNADVRLVSLTVDPRSDTPPVLAKWGARFGADTNRWYFLTGNKPVLHGLIAQSFLAQDNGDPFNSMPGNFTGTERIAVVDKHGRTRIYFDGLQPETSAAVVAEIAQLRGEN
jgi:cytochrome oxidase Cu insertion factor (SCO1/SenC/PrrC family)